MSKSEIQKPAGLTAMCDEIDRICQQASLYRRRKIGSYIVNLNPGEGRSTLLEYMADRFKESGAMEFYSSLEDYIEIKMDGSLDTLQREQIHYQQAADYSNIYDQIIGVHGSAMAEQLSQTHGQDFIEFCEAMAKEACVVFFVGAQPTRNEEKLVDKLMERVKGIRRIQLEPYTQEELVQVIQVWMTDSAVKLEDGLEGREALMALIQERQVKSVREAVALAAELLGYADFRESVARLSVAALRGKKNVK